MNGKIGAEVLGSGSASEIIRVYQHVRSVQRS